MDSLPKYISYKASLLREKLVLSHVVLIVTSILLVYFIVSRIEIYGLQQKLRTKEFILAPGIRDFTPVNPGDVPASYIHDAVTDFVSSLGNVNASNIVEEYDGLKKFMSDELKIKFEAEVQGWIQQVLSEDIAQILKIKNKTISLDSANDLYHAKVVVDTSIYSNKTYIGNEEQFVEMDLSLTPPDRGKRWFIKIEKLAWSKGNSISKNNNKQQQSEEEE